VAKIIKMERTDYKQEINITETLMNRINELISHYPADKIKSALLPVLHEVQDAHDNWLSIELQDKVAEILSIKPIEVYEVATFYTMFHTNPVGNFVLEVCRTGPCCLLGAEQVIDRIKERYNIHEGETSADGMFTLKPVECLAACGFAPVMQIREQYFEQLSVENIDGLLDQLAATDPKTIGYVGNMPVEVK
jgi:NADH-quinone oxidoreductase subunit E